MATNEVTSNFQLSQYTDNEPISFLTNYNTDMKNIDTKALPREIYDPTNTEGDVFRASNSKMTGYTVAPSYSAIIPTDRVTDAIAKLEAAAKVAGDMRAAMYDPTSVKGDAFRASNNKMTGYTLPGSYAAVSSSNSVTEAIGKLEAGVKSNISTGQSHSALLAGLRTDVDSVVSSGYIPEVPGTSYGWVWVKYSDGTMECWTSITKTATFTTWDAVSSSPAISLLAWPTGITFIPGHPIARHCEPQTATYQDSGTKGAYLTYYSGNAVSVNAPGTFYLTQVNGTGLSGKSVAFTVAVRVIGKWK